MVEAATIPLVTLTAAISLFRRQGLPTPWTPKPDSDPPIPLVIYGASSALGSFAIKLAKAAGIHPIIAIGGGSSKYIASLLETGKGDTLVDYRNGIDAMKASVQSALGGLKAHHALDAVSARGTWVPLSQMLEPHHSILSVVSGGNRYDEAEIHDGVKIVYTFVGTVHLGGYKEGMVKQPEDALSLKGDIEFAYVLVRFVARMLASGRYEGHPYEVIPGGLEGVGEGLRRLKQGKAKGVKYVYRVEETNGL